MVTAAARHMVVQALLVRVLVLLLPAAKAGAVAPIKVAPPLYIPAVVVVVVVVAAGPPI